MYFSKYNIIEYEKNIFNILFENKINKEEYNSLLSYLDFLNSLYMKKEIFVLSSDYRFKINNLNQEIHNSLLEKTFIIEALLEKNAYIVIDKDFDYWKQSEIEITFNKNNNDYEHIYINKDNISKYRENLEKYIVVNNLLSPFFKINYEEAFHNKTLMLVSDYNYKKIFNELLNYKLDELPLNSIENSLSNLMSIFFNYKFNSSFKMNILNSKKISSITEVLSKDLKFDYTNKIREIFYNQILLNPNRILLDVNQIKNQNSLITFYQSGKDVIDKKLFDLFIEKTSNTLNKINVSLEFLLLKNEKEPELIEKFENKCYEFYKNDISNHLTLAKVIKEKMYKRHIQDETVSYFRIYELNNNNIKLIFNPNAIVKSLKLENYTILIKEYLGKILKDEKFNEDNCEIIFKDKEIDEVNILATKIVTKIINNSNLGVIRKNSDDELFSNIKREIDLELIIEKKEINNPVKINKVKI